MLYPFMTLNDNTEIVHSESLQKDGKEQVEVRIEKPVYGGFHSASCWLPSAVSCPEASLLTHLYRKEDWSCLIPRSR